MMLGHYVRRFFTSLSRRPPTPADEAWAAAVATPAEYALLRPTVEPGPAPPGRRAPARSRPRSVRTPIRSGSGPRCSTTSGSTTPSSAWSAARSPTVAAYGLGHDRVRGWADRSGLRGPVRPLRAPRRDRGRRAPGRRAAPSRSPSGRRCTTTPSVSRRRRSPPTCSRSSTAPTTDRERGGDPGIRTFRPNSVPAGDRPGGSKCGRVSFGDSALRCRRWSRSRRSRRRRRRRPAVGPARLLADIPGARHDRGVDDRRGARSSEGNRRISRLTTTDCVNAPDALACRSAKVVVAVSRLVVAAPITWMHPRSDPLTEEPTAASHGTARSITPCASVVPKPPPSPPQEGCRWPPGRRSRRSPTAGLEPGAVTATVVRSADSRAGSR